MFTQRQKYASDNSSKHLAAEEPIWLVWKLSILTNTNKSVDNKRISCFY